MVTIPNAEPPEIFNLSNAAGENGTICLGNGYYDNSFMTTAVINVVFNYFLIAKYVTMGAAIATFICQIVASYACHLFLPETRIILMQQTKALLPINLFID